jgi:hypothetical protein
MGHPAFVACLRPLTNALGAPFKPYFGLSGIPQHSTRSLKRQPNLIDNLQVKSLQRRHVRRGIRK